MPKIAAVGENSPCLITHSMRAGGAERVIAQMANHWAAQGRQVNVITFTSLDSKPFYDLHERVILHPLGQESESASFVSALSANLRRFKALRSVLQTLRPSVTISFLEQTNVLNFLATRGTGAKTVLCERNNPKLCPLGRPWRLLRQITYPLADRLVVQTEASRAQLGTCMRSRARVIPNPISLRHVEPRVRTSRKKKIMAVGRLVPQKGFDLLIHAFYGIHQRHPEWSLEIWGEGPLHLDLQNLIASFNLAEHAALRGKTADIFKEFLASDLFVLSSRYEGFPNVLCEAMACGLPSISTDCDFGPREIIRAGVDGMLVPPGNVQALEAAIERLATDEAERNRLAARAPEVLVRFGLDKIMRAWDTMLSEICSPGSKEFETEAKSMEVEVLS